MAVQRIIQHPGVEIREIDRSNYAGAIAGTYCLVTGYADKGEDYEPVIAANTQDFDAYYGQPTNEAERYFTYAAQEVLQGGGTLVAAKLPYNNVVSQQYRGVSINFSTSALISTLSGGATTADAKLRMAGTTEVTGGYYAKYCELSSQMITLPLTDFDLLETGATWSSAAATSAFAGDFIIVNTSKDRSVGPGENESLFIAFVDPLDALRAQRIMPWSAYSSKFSGDVTMMDNVSGVSINGTQYADSAFDFTVQADISADSYSQQFARQFPTVAFDPVSGSINTEYSNFIGVIVAKTFTDQYSNGNLKMTILESFAGSVHLLNRDKATGQSNYIGDLINGGSQYIKWYAKITDTDLHQGQVVDVVSDVLDDTVVIYNRTDKVYPLLGFTKAECQKVINGPTVVRDLDVIFNKLANIDDIQLDVVADAGVSTIAQFTSAAGDVAAGGALFDPRIDYDADSQRITDGSNINVWRSTVNAFIVFCRDIRKDCMTILDVPRNLVLNGQAKIIRKSAPTQTFGTTIGQSLRFVTGLNCSYAALYGNWFQAVDKFTGANFWMPQSIKMLGVYCYNDATANIWDAPAGLNRGVIYGVNDIAYNPADKDADQLYIKSINYAKRYPLDGFIAEGQKTTQVKESAFDRVNVRRLFLRLERLTYRVARYFVYEPNNIYTRRRLLDTLKPTFDSFKAQGGLYDYQIVCDDRNNTPEVIDRNELKVAILIKPVKTCEYILCDFIATRTGANFTEVLQEFVG